MIRAEDIKEGTIFFHAKPDGITEYKNSYSTPEEFLHCLKTGPFDIELENCFLSSREAKERALVLLLKKVDSLIEELKKDEEEIKKALDRIKRQKKGLKKERKKLLKVKIKD